MYFYDADHGVCCFGALDKEKQEINVGGPESIGNRETPEFVMIFN